MLEGIELIYADYDLGEYDERFKGRTIKLLQNPSREFRNAFTPQSMRYGSQEWLDMLIPILGVADVAAVEAVIGPLDMELVIWLFCGLVEGYHEDTQKFDVMIRAHLFEVWDAYVRDRVKKRAAR